MSTGIYAVALDKKTRRSRWRLRGNRSWNATRRSDPRLSPHFYKSIAGAASTFPIGNGYPWCFLLRPPFRRTKGGHQFLFLPKHSAFCWKEIKKYRGKIVSAVRGFLSRIAMKRFLEKWFRTGIGKWSWSLSYNYHF